MNEISRGKRAMTRTHKVHRMTGAEIKKLRKQLNLTVTAAAASIAVSARTWQRWEGSSKPVPQPMDRLFKLTHGIKIS